MTCFKFSRNNRFGIGTSYEEFMKIARSVASLATAELPTAKVEVCLLLSRFRSDRHIISDMERAIKQRPSYQLDRFTKTVWNASSGVELTITNPETDKEKVFVIRVTWTWKQPDQVFFNGLGVDDELAHRILGHFDRESFMTTIGDGYDAEDLMIGRATLTTNW